MKEVVLPEGLRGELEAIYQQLQVEYQRVAEDLHFGCEDCPDNCCDSYFLHYTYAEWAYLWEGIQALTPEAQQKIIERSRLYLNEARNAMEDGERPQIMCPLNDKGRCMLYKHRLLVCRTHGVPAQMTRPDGQTMRFPGCFRCQELVDNRLGTEPSSYVERTTLLRKLAMLEQELLLNKRHLFPKVKKSIAEMVVQGPPKVARFHCEKKGLK